VVIEAVAMIEMAIIVMIEINEIINTQDKNKLSVKYIKLIKKMM
jgi:hypothetical protein